jgi:DNA-binding response OmpR family regulator
MSKATILVVEDEADIRELVQLTLERANYSVITAETGEEACKLAVSGLPDLIILDLMLPDMQGFDVCKRLRGQSTTTTIPIIMATARGEEVDVVLGLELGADDYIKKPFSLSELISRVRAVLRRSGTVRSKKNRILRVDSIEIDREGYEVRLDGELLNLTRAEFRLLTGLLESPGRVLSRDQLLDRITGGHTAIIDRNVDVHVRSLRSKLGDASAMIVTIRGVGYKCSPSG